MHVKTDSGSSVLLNRVGLIDTKDLNMTVGRLFMGHGQVDNSFRMSYSAHCRVTFYVRLYGKQNT